MHGAELKLAHADGHRSRTQPRIEAMPSASLKNRKRTQYLTLEVHRGLLAVVSGGVRSRLLADASALIVAVLCGAGPFRTKSSSIFSVKRSMQIKGRRLLQVKTPGESYVKLAKLPRCTIR